MKIGILTIQKSTSSYGANLQCYALWKYLASEGYDCEVVDLLRPCHKDYKPYRKLVKNESLVDNLSILNRIKLFLLDSLFKYKLVQKAPENFINFWKLISFSKVYTLRKLYSEKNNYDILITGADQVWNPTQLYKIEPYFLTFSNVKKISYASSLGLRQIPNNMRPQLSKWLNEYEYISVREEDLQKNLEEVVNKTIKTVVDPTLLLSKIDWENLLENNDEKKKFDNDYILYYSLNYDQDFLNLIYKNNDENKRIVIIDKNIIKENVVSYFCKSPLDFISLIKNASYVITDSYHCMIFSIIFDVPFVVIKDNANKNRISRMETVLKLCEYEIGIKDVENFELEDFLNYKINKNPIEQKIINSKNFLKKAIED